MCEAPGLYPNCGQMKLNLYSDPDKILGVCHGRVPHIRSQWAHLSPTRPQANAMPGGSISARKIKPTIFLGLRYYLISNTILSVRVVTAAGLQSDLS